jgi:outer membrane lipoprotein SlyB
VRFALRTLCLSVTAVLVACQQPGANLQANVYKAGQVNQQQDAKVIKILAVLPAKIEVDNEQAKATAQLVGGLAGGIGGALLGNSIGHIVAQTRCLEGREVAPPGSWQGHWCPIKLASSTSKMDIGLF